MTSDGAPTKPAGSLWLERGFSLAMLLACAVALSPNNVDPDLWGHVQYGSDWIVAGSLPRTATHTFTAVDYPWINHENLSELTLAISSRALGPRGLLVAKCLLGLGLVGLMLRAARRQKVDFPVICAFMLLVTTTLTAFWSLRPQVASFMLLGLMVVALDAAFAKWRNAGRVNYWPLCAIPPIMVIWTNSHGGFLAGLAILAAYFGCRSLEGMCRQGRKAWKPIACFSLVILFSALATLINPYGVGLIHWMHETLDTPPPEITEWTAPVPNDAFFIPFVLLLAVIFSAWCFTRKQRDWTHVALISVVIWQACLHSRHIAFVAILAGFWLPIHLQSVVDRVRTRRTAPDKPLGVWGTRLVGAGLCCALVLLVGKLGSRLADLPVERDEYPVEALQYIVDHNLNGRMVVAFNWAQYALYALQPQIQVGFDGRFNTCYPREIIDMHFDFLLGDGNGFRHRALGSGPIDGQRILDYQAPNLVLVDRRFPHSVQMMEQQDAFVLLYQDALAQLWGRRDRYDVRTSADYLAKSHRVLSSAPQTGSVTWPAMPVRSGSAAVVQTEQESSPFTFPQNDRS